MTKQAVHSDQAPAAIGPYSQGIISGNLLFVSGQTGRDADGVMPDSVTEQAVQSLKNVAAVLAAAGSSTDKVLKCTVFLTNMGDFSAVNEVYAQFMGAPCPARSCIQVAGLPMGAKVEVEAIAEV